jgi:hypothetical protein
MRPELAFPLDTAIAEMRRVFVELVPTTTKVAGETSNLANKDLKAFGARHFKPSNRPFEAHLVMVETQDEPIEEEHAVLVPASGAIVYTGPLWPHSEWLLDAQWSPDGRGWKTVKTVRSNANSAPPLAPAKGEHVEVMEAETPGAVRINASADFVAKHGAIWVKIKVKALLASFTGDASHAPHIFLAQPNRPLAEKTKTLVHELGHALGLVKKGSPFHYSSDNGGTGDHCRTGATDNVPSLAAGGSFKGEYQSGTCVMFHESSEHYRFCSTCLAQGRAASMNEEHLKTRGW